MRYLTVIRLLVAGLLSLCLVYTTATAAPLKIGVQSSLSGDLTRPGKDILNGITLALEDIGAHNYELIIEDDECASAKAVRAATKLTSLDKVSAVIGMACNSTLLPTAPIYSRAKVPVISAWATTGDVRDVGPFVYRIFTPDNVVAERLTAYIARRHTTVGLLTEIEAYTELVDRSIQRMAGSPAAPNLAIIGESLPIGTQDYRSVLSRLLASNPQAIILNSYVEASGAEMIKQLRSRSKDLPVYMLYYPSSDDLRAKYPGVFEGVIFVDAPEMTDALSAEGTAIKERFLKKFGYPLSSPYVWALGYESMRLAHLVLSSGQDPASYFKGRQISGGPFPPYTFSEFGDSVGLKPQIKAIKNNKVEVIER